MDLFIGFFELNSIWKKTQKQKTKLNSTNSMHLIGSHIQPIKSEIDGIIASWNFLFDWNIYLTIYIQTRMCYEMFVRLWCGLYTALGVVVVRAQCGLYATSVLRLCKFGGTSIQFLCDFSATFVWLSHKQKRTWVAEYGRKESAGGLDL